MWIVLMWCCFKSSIAKGRKPIIFAAGRLPGGGRSLLLIRFQVGATALWVLSESQIVARMSD